MTIVNWVVDADGDWSSKSNWSAGALPGSGNSVVLNSVDPHTVTHSVGTDVVGTLSAVSDNLAISGGSLRVVGAVNLAAGVAVTAGTLVLAGGGGISGSFTASGGIIAMGVGATVGVSGRASFAGQTSFTGAGTLATSGTTTVGADASSITMGGGFAWTNRSAASIGGSILTVGTVKFTNIGGAQFNLTSDAAGIIASGGVSTFSNAGLLAKTGGTGTTEIDSVLTSTGTISVASGTLLLTNGGAVSGALRGAGTLRLAATSTTQLGSLAGDGTGGQLLSLGLLKIAASATDSATIVQQGGTLSLATGAVLTTTGRLVLANAALVTGAATLATNGNTSVGADMSATSLRGGLTWINRGLATVGGKVLTLNTTTISNVGGASFLLNGDAAGIFASGGNSTFSNAGTLTKAGGNGTSEIDSTLNSTGTIAISSGTLLLTTGGAVSGTLAGPGTLDLAAGSTTVLGNLTATGGGSIIELGAMSLAGSVVKLNAAMTVQGGTLGLLTGATLTSTSALALTDGAIVRGLATLSTTGLTNVAADGSTIGLRGGLTWINSGALFLAGQIQTLNVTTFNNDATGRITLQSDGASIIASGGYSIFNNSGLLAKVGGIGTSEIDSTLNSTGTIAINSGTILLANGGAISGTLAGPGTLQLGATSNTTLGNLIATGGGTMLSLGMVTLAGSAVNLSAAMIIQGGTLGMLTGATLTTTSRLVLTDGALVGGAATLSTSGATTVASDGSTIGLRGGLTWNNHSTVVVGGQIQTLNTSTFNNFAGSNFNLASDGAGIIASGGGSAFGNSGVLAKTGGSGTSEIDSTLTNAGTIAVASGTLLLTANAQLGGLLSGGGTLELAGSLNHVGSLSSTAASNLLLDSGTHTTFAGSTLSGAVVASQASFQATVSNDSFGGGLTQTGGTISVDSLITLTLGGGSRLLGGVAINGAGTVATTGATTIGADGTAVSFLHTTLDNLGSLTVDASLAANGNAEFDNADGAVFGLANDAAGIQVVGGKSLFNNAGTLVKAGGNGTSTVDCMVNSSGTITVASGTLDLDGGGTFSGSLNGNGTLLLGGGPFSVAAGAAVNIGTLVVAGSSVSFAGALATSTLLMSAGSITLAGSSNTITSLSLGAASMTLSGAATLGISGAASLSGGGTISGTGTLATSGATTLAAGGGGLSLNGGVVWNNTGGVSLADAITCSGGTPVAIDNAAGTMFGLAADGAGVLDGTGQGSTFSNEGLLTKVAGAGTSTIDSVLTSTGTIAVASGTLDLDGGGAISGLMRGAGTLMFGGGDFTVDGATAVTVSSLAVTGGSVTFGGNAGLNFGSLDMAVGSLFLAGGNNLTVTGAADFTDGSNVDGSATLLTRGAVALAADGSYASFSDGLTWKNSGTVTASGAIYTGGWTASPVAFINTANGVFNLASDAAGIFVTGSTSSFENDGIFAKTGGTATSFVYSSVTNYGTLVANSGTLTLEFSANLSGTVGGNQGGIVQLASGATSAGALTISDNGASTSIQLGSGYANWTNTGTVTDAGRVVLGDASNSGPAILYNAVGAVWNLTGNDGSITARGPVIFNNAGTIAKVSGNGVSAIGCGLNNSGLIDVASGTLAIQGSVSGTGTLRVEAGGTLEMGAAVETSQTVILAGIGATLKLDKAASIAGVLQGFGAGDKIDLAATTATGATISGNVLTVTAGSASYTFTSAQSLAGLTAQISSDGTGGSLVTLNAASLALASPKFVAARTGVAPANPASAFALTASAMRLADLAPAPVSAGSMGQLQTPTIAGGSLSLGIWPASSHAAVPLAFVPAH